MATMQEEMIVLTNNGTCTLGPLPDGMKVVGCKWVHFIKFKLDGTVDRLKARLVANG